MLPTDTTCEAVVFSSGGTWRGLKFPGIYSFVNRVNGKVYVGQAVNIAKRLKAHRYTTSNCRVIHRAFQKYGFDAFDVRVLEKVDDFSTIDAREQFWIELLDACNPLAGYNINPQAGTRRGAKLSEQSKEKLRIASSNRSPETRAKLRAASSNPTPEMRAKLSAAKKGKHVSPSHRASLIRSREKMKHPVFQIDARTNEIIRRWDSITEAANKLGISHISSCCTGKRKTAGKFKWVYASNQE